MTLTSEYVQMRSDQLTAAFDRRDGDAAVAVLNLIRLDGHGDFADQLLRRLVEAGLKNVAAGR